MSRSSKSSLPARVRSRSTEEHGADRGFLRRLRRSERGQGMSEYIIIVALIAIAAIGVITIFGESIREIFSASTSALSGNTNVRVQKARVKPSYVRNKSLKNFAKGND